MAETTTPQRRVVARRYKRQGRYFTEALSAEVGLDMVQIPGGTFQMGQTAEERETLIREVGEERYQNSYAWELPRHEVRVPMFFMGRYPVTQAQWRIVAGWPTVERELEPDPANFKGDDRPVEQVSWDDAMEFCQRLAARTQRQYRLPSEAEWEYACRAGTTTPFHFGETIDATLANYRAEDEKIGDTLYKGAYGKGVEGEHRRETTEVGIFPPNDFGLHDMHGNVWEWCADRWHGNYDGAPTDGSAWLEGWDEDLYLLRSGSWNFYPAYCRSACRGNDSRDNRVNNIGFRVCCDAPRTLGP